MALEEEWNSGFQAQKTSYLEFKFRTIVFKESNYEESVIQEQAEKALELKPEYPGCNKQYKLYRDFLFYWIMPGP